MQKSDDIALLAAALAAAQGEMKNPPKDKINPHFKSRYADLATTLDTSRPILAKHGLALLMFPKSEGSKVTVTPMLTHKSGQWIIGDGLEMLARDASPQSMGSAITYGRRYLGGGFTAQAPDDDDDGEVAQPVPQKPAQTPSRTLAPAAKGYDGGQAHQKILEAALRKEKIDEVFWERVHLNMQGKAFTELEAVIKQVLAQA